MASHGGLFERPPMKMRHENLRLFLIASRGYCHLGGQDESYREQLIISLNYLKVLIEGVEKETAGGGPFHDDEGCLTELGEETLANMIVSMAFSKSYSEHYGVEFPKTPDGVSHFAAKRFLTRAQPDRDWSVPFLSLKIYDSEYNDHAFEIDNTLNTRFGILFQYRDKKDNDIKTVFLNLINLASEFKSRGYVLLSDIFDTINPLFLESKGSGLQFNFTHMSCRTDLPDATLTRNFSNKGSESSSRHCFIRKFSKGMQSRLTIVLERFDTIYEFYNKLKEKRKYDKFLYLLNRKEKFDEEANLYKFIIDFGVLCEEEEIQGIEAELRHIEQQLAEIEAARQESALQEQQEADTGERGGGKLIKRKTKQNKSKEKNKSKRRKSKRRKINKKNKTRKKSKKRYRK